MRKRWYGTLLAAFFTVNLMVGAGEAACITPMAASKEIVSDGVHSSDPMADMRMDEASAASGNSGSPTSAPCDSGKLPVNCITGAGCISNGLLVAIPERTTPPRVASSLTIPKLTQPTSRSTAPEPPPPRS
ncbi:MAG: hypothetical protein ABI681_05185 [Gemmatimonadales bacterium]